MEHWYCKNFPIQFPRLQFILFICLVLHSFIQQFKTKFKNTHNEQQMMESFNHLRWLKLWWVLKKNIFTYISFIPHIPCWACRGHWIWGHDEDSVFSTSVAKCELTAWCVIFEPCWRMSEYVVLFSASSPVEKTPPESSGPQDSAEASSCSQESLPDTPLAPQPDPDAWIQVEKRHRQTTAKAKVLLLYSINKKNL